MLPVPLPSPAADVLGIALDTVKAVGQGVAGAAEVIVQVTVSAGIAVTDAVVHAMTNPIETISTLPRAVAAAPRVAWYLLRYSAETVDDGFDFAVHPSRLADALTLLGDQNNRAVNDASSVTKLLLSHSSRTFWSGEPGTSKAIAWSSPLSLPAIKAISRSQHATVNDVLLAAVAGGVHRYLQEHHAEAREIQWLVPVNLKPFAEICPKNSATTSPW